MRITRSATTAAAAKAQKAKYEAMCKRKIEEKVKINSRLERKQEEDKIIALLKSDEKVRCLTPATLLSNEQWEAQSDMSILIKFIGVEKDVKENCWKPKWWEASRGGKYSAGGEGSLVIDADSIDDLKKKRRDRHYFFRDVIVTGGNLPETGGKIIVAKWTIMELAHDSTEYTDSLLNQIRRCKNTIIPATGEKHHGSCGEHFGYGCKASYDALVNKPNGNSVCPFAGDNQHESIVAKSLGEGVEGINNNGYNKKNIPGSSVVTKATVIPQAIKRGAHDSNSKLKGCIFNVKGTRFPAGFVCVNAVTERQHTEKDCSYTLIFVPKQAGLASRQTSSGYSFNFYLDGDKAIEVPMQLGTSIFFSGYFLQHKQCRAPGAIKTMVNVSAYGNKPLFEKSQATIMRNVARSAKK